MTGQAKVRRRLAYQPEFQHVAGAGDKDDIAEAAAVFVASQDGTIEIDLAQLVPSTSASTSTAKTTLWRRRKWKWKQMLALARKIKLSRMQVRSFVFRLITNYVPNFHITVIFTANKKVYTCSKCSLPFTTTNGHSQFKGKRYCPTFETLKKEDWLAEFKK